MKHIGFLAILVYYTTEYLHREVDFLMILRYNLVLHMTIMGLKDIQLYNEKQQQLYAARTGIVVDIQNIGKNTKTIALKAKKSLEEIHKDVWLKIEAIDFPDGNFTNVYDLFWDAKNANLSPYLHSEKYPYYLLDSMENDPSILAVINGAFFFLIDVVDKEPQDYPFHFCIRNGKVIGLLSSNEPIIYTIGQKLYAKEPKAQGTINIAGTIISWVGSKINEKMDEIDAVLYNSGSSKLIKVFDPKTGVRMGTLDNNFIHTPSKQDAVDLVINHDENGDLKISSINVGGGTHYFEGLFILQIHSKDTTYKVGDVVTPLTLDGLELKNITAGITVNKGVKDPFFLVPERIGSRDARSVIAKDVSGNIHFFVFDGSKYIPKFKGVSAKDITPYFSEDKFEWAYFLDGGSSSRIIVKDGNNYKFLANDFAFRKVTNEIFLWDSKRHRKLASSIALKSNTA